MLNNPLQYTDPTGHDRRCDTVGCAGKVYNQSSQSVLIQGERRIEGCLSNGDECFETVTIELKPGESSLDYGFVDVDFISATDMQHPLAGRGSDVRLKMGDASTVTIGDDGRGGMAVIVTAPRWAWR